MHAGTHLTLAGANFAPTVGLRCNFSSAASGGHASVAASFLSFERAECEVPGAALLGASEAMGELTVTLSLDGGATASAITPAPLRYTRLLISHVEPEAGPTLGGTAVTLHGVGMRDVSRCRFGGERQLDDPLLHHAVAPLFTSDERVVCPRRASRLSAL